MAITYIVALATLVMINNERPFFNALVPAIAFSISIQTITPIKRWWLKRRKHT